MTSFFTFVLMRFLTSFLAFLIVTAAYGQRPEDCIIKLKSGWGPIASCTGEDSYHVILRSDCSSSVDLVCGLQERSGEWKVFQKNQLASGDTLLAFACDGSGKFQYWVRFAGDTSHLPTYDELNPGKVKSSSVFDLFAKLLYGDNKKQPLKNQKVELVNSKGETVQCSVTDQHGDFVFHKLSNTEKYEVFVGDVSLEKDEKLFLAKQNGAILSELKLVKDKNYKYSFLPSDMVTLSMIEVEDPKLSLESFKRNKVSTFGLRQKLFYESGAVSPREVTKLDLFVSFLKENPKFKLEVVSHTDSRGDDQSNLSLSVKRSLFVKDYFIQKGVDKSRIKAVGEGERKLLNHCGNDSSCSEADHQENRRTEFFFDSF